MANNLFISYDLDSPGQNYAKVDAAIKALGASTKVLLSMYYVKTVLSAQDAEARVWRAMDPNDRLVVINASDAWFDNSLPGSIQMIQAHWNV